MDVRGVMESGRFLHNLASMGARAQKEVEIGRAHRDPKLKLADQRRNWLQAILHPTGIPIMGCLKRCCSRLFSPSQLRRTHVSAR